VAFSFALTPFAKRLICTPSLLICSTENKFTIPHLTNCCPIRPRRLQVKLVSPYIKNMKRAFVICCLLGFAFISAAQTKVDSMHSRSLAEQIFYLDSILFSAFNNCDLEKFASLLDDNLEFYDDRQGLNTSKDAELQSLQNRCSNRSVKMRRVVVRESLQVYPLGNFGAVQMGEHLFYESSNGGAEQLRGKAYFVHIWKNTKGKWTISRIISYAHRPVN
jgi:hypothetical protein